MQRFHTVLASVFLFLTPPLAAQDLRVLTSFPLDVSDAYVAMWDRIAPDAGIRVLNKNTVAGINEILRGNSRGFDVFWASSPEAFELLSRNNSFMDGAVCGADGPGAVEPFALSSVGWARRSDSSMFMPADWNDLLKPMYRDQVAMARPARSGTTHMMVEQLLLVRGWDDGWAYLLELAGNLSTLTARSYGVPDGVKNRRFEIGLTIDFLAQAQRDVVDFRYGRPIVLAAAQIGILKGGASLDKACDFVRMVLSREGQLALLSPEIARIPYDAAVRAEVKDQLPDGIAEALQLSWLDYDAQMTSDRYWAVNTLFDLLIAEPLVMRRDLWRRLYALEGRAGEGELRRLRKLLTTMPVSQEKAVAATVGVEAGHGANAVVDTAMLEPQVVTQWRDLGNDLLQQVDQGLHRLEARFYE
ncbi:ABC transporter substrate-binding protein [Celeribacter sp.]|uniref:ABC transporter substrate-binding protein n=1 Tax=Celeribacter sp. TaxID=1890673 RepID=UPI003A9084E2